jgi:mannose-6-phosphate isomerase-like protein (cupin superfamily)
MKCRLLLVAAVLVVAAALAAGTLGRPAGASPSGTYRGVPMPGLVRVDSILGAHRTSSDPPVYVERLGDAGAMSSHLLLIRSTVGPQTHDGHDQVLYLMRGKGDLTIGRSTRTMVRNDVAFVPRGTSYGFINTGGGSAALVAFMTPAFTGNYVVVGAGRP